MVSKGCMVVRKSMDRTISSYGARSIIRCLFILIGVLVVGTIGYMIIEGLRFFDALYMTVITISTVGYREVGTISGPGRAFTIVIIFLGIGTVGYTFGVLAQAMLDFQLRSFFGRRKLGLKIKSINSHYILCGYGRIGRIISQELKRDQIPLLVLDNNLDLKETLEHHDLPYIIGDATSEDILLEAGIERAKGLIAVVESDANNLFITMTARGLNPDLFILSRADEEQTHKKLLRAGANRVVEPYLVGGQKMAHTIIKPAVAEFLELMIHDRDVELEIEELVVGESSRLKGVTLVDSEIRKETNVIIVAIRKDEGEMTFNPSSQTRIEAGDTLIALGYDSDLKKLASISADG